MKYDRRNHAARSTESYVFNQLIPYIGNKRKLLPLIDNAVKATGLDPARATFLDAFAGSGVVSRYAKSAGFEVLCNDWEPYAEAINGCYIGLNSEPMFFDGRSYQSVLDELNNLPPVVGWITEHLCPDSDDDFDVKRDRLFYMRKNGMRLDAIRLRLEEWEAGGLVDRNQINALLAPLLYQASYTSNTSGVFKGFHNGWGGQTGTALYRIKGDLKLEPAVFYDNQRSNKVYRSDATVLAKDLAKSGRRVDLAYLDPPYNQHPYGSNYHVLNTVTLYDRPALSRKISGHGDKSAIRMDWRTERRSAYNSKSHALDEYRHLLSSLDAHWIATSFSTDGFIDLEGMTAACLELGHTEVFLQGYKRYRVSSQRFSEKPMNVEFVLLIDTSRPAQCSAEALCEKIMTAEKEALASHPEVAQSAMEFSFG